MSSLVSNVTQSYHVDYNSLQALWMSPCYQFTVAPVWSYDCNEEIWDTSGTSKLRYTHRAAIWLSSLLVPLWDGVIDHGKDSSLQSEEKLGERGIVLEWSQNMVAHILAKSTMENFCSNVLLAHAHNFVTELLHSDCNPIIVY